MNNRDRALIVPGDVTEETEKGEGHQTIQYLFVVPFQPIASNCLSSSSSGSNSGPGTIEPVREHVLQYGYKIPTQPISEALRTLPYGPNPFHGYCCRSAEFAPVCFPFRGRFVPFG